MGFRTIFCISLLLVGTFFHQNRGSTSERDPVDLMLVIATDVSNSVQENENGINELALQKEGLLRALRSPQVARLIEQCSSNGIGITYVEWSGTHYERQARQVVTWSRLSTAEDLSTFADQVARAPKRAFDDLTDIGDALNFSREIIESSPYESTYRLILISGDGAQGVYPRDQRHTPSGLIQFVQEARDRILALDVSIAAVTIQSYDPLTGRVFSDVHEHYRENVIGGPMGFLEPVEDFFGYRDVVESVMHRLLNICHY